MVKLQAWESLFAERVEEARTQELKGRRKIAYLQGANSALTESAAIACTLVSFIVYGFVSDEPLTATKAFTTLALFNILKMPIMVIPMLIGLFANALVSAKRLANFLYSDEIQTYVKYGIGGCQKSVVVKNAAFTWEEAGLKSGSVLDNSAIVVSGHNANDSYVDMSEDMSISNGHSAVKKKFELTLEDFSLAPGTLTVIAGKVGSGKSSFLAALLGEMRLRNLSGKAIVELNGSVAYCAQEPWIQNCTLKDNIIFGQPFDQRRYDEVIEACALSADIAALPGGDQTEIGERGINLSGGQKARVSLGRACYSNSEIVILDDVLSAVDAHVARTITDKCLLDLLRNRNRTVLLATHQTLCFPDADALVIIDDGRILFNGPFTSASSMEELNYFGFLGSSAQARYEKDNEDPVHSGVAEKKESLSKKKSGDHHKVLKLVDEKEVEKEGKLTETEKTETGAVTAAVWAGYLRLVGGPMFATILFLAMGLNAQQIVVNWWLSVWSTAGDDESNTKTTNYYMLIYFLLALLACSLILVYQLTAATGGLRAAAEIHGNMFTAILKAPLSYFDTTPSGRLLNLFTADIKLIDESLISQLSGSMSLLFMMLSVLGTIIVAVPFIIVAVVPLFVFYGWIQLIYRNTARELKRFDSATVSPIFNHFAETVNGLSSIRAFRCEKRMMLETEARINNNSRYWTKSNWVNRWSSIFHTACRMYFHKMNRLNFKHTQLGLACAWTR